MNFGSIAKVLLIGGGGITTVGALPSIVSSSSENFSSNKRTKRSTSLNQEGIKAKGKKIGLESYCFYFDNEGIVGVPSNKGACENNYAYHIGTTGKEFPRIRYKWEGGQAESKQVLLLSGTSKEKGMFDGEDGSRNIIGCIEPGWWGKTHRSTTWNWNQRKGTAKVGAGYMKEQEGNLSKNSCSNGKYESTTGVSTGMAKVQQKYNQTEVKDKNWTIKYFGDLTWTLEW